MNSTITNCPLPKGIYTLSGYDTSLLNDNNFPKVYFYGKYKYVGKIKNKNNKVVGCLTADLSAGEYRMIITAVYQCAEEPKDLPLKFNIYLNKKSSNTTEVRGNLTSELPFDDSLIVRFDVNFASWSLTGGWKPNSLVYVTNNACSKLKSILGNSWYSLTKAINSPTTNCPIPKGIYISSGYDTTLFNDNNFPKVYFYGKYKYVGKIKNKNKKVIGCLAAELSFVRPWELTL
ncbi:hypothetical protein AGLY_013960 [Aphis glycines]|uniref:MD-2-related lipid-recognition domain-containing protein n=1 Tax=Aphis glycines TaxID=307491 RepID=A0A6G0T6V0_APHGL|nr:hypothetical protein AGLY_013960 [Aphis glycines]